MKCRGYRCRCTDYQPGHRKDLVLCANCKHAEGTHKEEKR